MEEEKKNEQGLASETHTDLVEEASALKELSDKIKNLESENSELKEAKKKYYDAILNGQTVEEVAPKFRTKKEISKDLFGREDKENMSNLDYAKLIVELDEACLREEGESCFLPKGRDVVVNANEVLSAKNFRDCLDDCIEEAKDDPEIFDQALSRRIKKDSRKLI